MRTGAVGDERASRAPSLDFSGLIREGDLVVCGQATAEPLTLTEALVAQAGRLPAFRMMVGPMFSDTFSAACAPNISFQSYGVIGNARRLAKAGRLDVIPSNYSAFCADFAARTPSRRCGAGATRGRSGDGRLSASLSNDYVIDAARGARVVDRRDQSGCALDIRRGMAGGRRRSTCGSPPRVRPSNCPRHRSMTSHGASPHMRRA